MQSNDGVPSFKLVLVGDGGTGECAHPPHLPEAMRGAPGSGPARPRGPPARACELLGVSPLKNPPRAGPGRGFCWRCRP